MSIKRINEFPEGSGSLSGDDIFLFMDNSSASGVTKKITLSELSNAIAVASSSSDRLIKDDKEVILIGNGSLTLPSGSILSETNNTVSLMPPTAASGQSLVIRPTATSEQSHVHLVAGNPSTVDIYLGDDDQYVKIEKDGGDVVIGTQGTLTANNSYINGTDFSTDVDLGMGIGIIAGWYQRTASQIEFALFGDSTFQSYLTGLALGRTVIVTYTNGATPSGTATLTAILTQTFGSTGQADPNNPTRSRVSGRIDAILPTVVGELSIVSINFPVYSTNTNNWAFGTDGSTTFPNSISIDEYYGSQFPRIVAESGKAFSVQGQGSTGSAALAWIEYASTSSQYAAVGVSKGGGDNLANVVITAGASTPTLKVWRFDESGTIKFPDNTTQTSAGIPSNTGLVPNSASITNMVSISQANYDALVTKNSTTLYVIS